MKMNISIYRFLNLEIPLTVSRLTSCRPSPNPLWVCSKDTMFLRLMYGLGFLLLRLCILPDVGALRIPRDGVCKSEGLLLLFLSYIFAVVSGSLLSEFLLCARTMAGSFLV